MMYMPGRLCAVAVVLSAAAAGSAVSAAAAATFPRCLSHFFVLLS